MEDPKRRFHSPQWSDPQPGDQRRRMSRIVHDHKGTASVEWHDAPDDYERPVLELEGARPRSGGPRKMLNTGGLSIHTEDSHDPYTRAPSIDRKSAAGRPKDLRRLSAWIKLMRELEQAKRRSDEDGE